MKSSNLYAAPAIRFLNKTFLTIRQPLLVNAFFLFGINFIPGLVGFIFWGIASRRYPAPQIGFASAIISSVVLVSSIAGLGTNIGLIRFLSEERNQIRFLNSIFTVNFIISIIFSLCFIFGIDLFASALKPLRSSFPLFSLFIIFVEVATVGTNVRDTFIASRKAHFALIYTLITNLSRLPPIFLFVNLGATGIIGITTFGFLLALLICLTFYIPKVVCNYRFFFRLDFRLIRNLIPYSIGNYLAGLLGQLNQTIIPIMVLNFLGPEDNAYAYIALMISGFLTSPGIALATSAFAEGSNDLKKTKSTLLQAAYIGMVVTIPITFLTMISANRLLAFFGQQYLEAGDLLKYLAISSPFMVLVQLYFTYLRIYKFTTKLLIISGLISLITISSSYFLIPFFGILAVGISFIFGSCCGFVLILWELVQNLRRLNNLSCYRQTETEFFRENSSNDAVMPK